MTTTIMFLVYLISVITGSDSQSLTGVWDPLPPGVSDSSDQNQPGE